STNYYSNTAGKRSYELTNWLGSVISVVSDMKYWSSESRPGTIYQTSFEGGDEKMFIGSDGSYTSSADRASEGSKSLKLDASTANEDLYGPNVREFVKAGNVVEISAETYWLQNTNNTYNRGGGIVYSLIDNDGNFLKDASGNNIWHEITLNGAWGDDPNEWNHQEENWTIPSVYKNGVLYGTTNPDENITLHVYPYNALGISNTTFYDELKVSISRSNETEEFFAAVIEESADYHEFGMRQEGRGIKGSNKYSFGYQGSREDNEISGDGNSYTTEFRGLDVRLGRWMSCDDVLAGFESPYTSMANDPINLTDVNGQWPSWDDFQLGLDVASGFLAVAGMPHIAAAIETVNIGISVGRGNYKDAAVRFAATVTGVFIAKKIAQAVKVISKIKGAAKVVAKTAKKALQFQKKVQKSLKSLKKADDAIKEGTEKLYAKIPFPKKKMGADKGTDKATDVNKNQQQVKEKEVIEAKDPAQAKAEQEKATVKSTDEKVGQEKAQVQEEKSQSEKVNNETNNSTETPNSKLALKNSVKEELGDGYVQSGYIKNEVKNTELLTKLNESSEGDWKKVYEAGVLNGNKVEIHYFKNFKTGEVFDVKVKYNYWHQKSFKALDK
ncbi:MAG: hypothetical protein ACKOXB_10150, partial [Flavobacteriales bacterium]